MAGNRAFSAAAIIVLALGIGANSVIFSVVNAVLLSSLPYPDADRIVMLFESDRQRQTQEAVAAANFLDWRDRNQVFESIAAFRGESMSLTGADRPERVSSLITTSDLFSVLSVNPMLGRVFGRDEESLGNSRVAVISQSLWERRFGADQNILGQKLTANGEPFTIIGVMPGSFRFPNETDLWIPPRQVVPEHVLRPSVDMTTSRDSHYLSAIARLKPGITIRQASAEMDTIANRLEELYPDNEGRGVNLTTIREDAVGKIRPTLLVLFGAVGFVLLIACSNVANLLLARGASRQKEMAIRTALGASRFRLVRQLLTESVLLAIAGGALGILLALWGINALVSLIPAGITPTNGIQIDTVVFGFTLVLSMFTGLVFGVVPAWQATKGELNESLKDGGRGGSGGKRLSRARNLLIISEIALSLVLLIGAGLMIKSFIRLVQVNPGFETEHIATIRLSLPAAQYSTPTNRAMFFQQVITKIQGIPGVQSTGAISRLPLTPGNSSRGLNIEGRAEFNYSLNVDYRVISRDYFQSMGIRLMEGRDIDDHDNKASSGVVIINETMARRFWPNESALGRRVRSEGDESQWMEVVGIVEDVKHFGLESQSKPEIYVPYFSDPWPFMTIVVRSSSDLASLSSALRNEVWSVDKNIPIPEIRTIEQLLSNSVARPRFNMLLLGIFAGIALVLSAVGVYGVMSYSVIQRTHEIGIRMALGAARSDVLKLVIGQGMRLLLIGIGLGLVAALALTRVLATMLFGVEPTDPATFTLISVLLAGVALTACIVPARRATKVDPIVALRYE
jgi:putative ABC transport system permease protein